MDYRAHGGVWINGVSVAVEERHDGWAVVSTRWYRKNDEKDFEDCVVEQGLSTRVDAEARLAYWRLVLNGTPCNRPGPRDVHHALMGYGSTNREHQLAAARLALRYPDASPIMRNFAQWILDGEPTHARIG